MRFGISIKSYNLVMETLAKYSQVEKGIIFGSRAIGNYKHGSDIDLAICGKDVTIEIVDEISIELNEKLPIPYYFDIVHYEGLNHEGLREHIDTYGKLLYKKAVLGPPGVKFMSKKIYSFSIFLVVLLARYLSLHSFL